MVVHLEDEAATERLGAALAMICPPGALIYLHGDLGAGKTTLARAFLRAFGVSGPIKSPTYTLLEPYQTASQQLFHFDLYRLGDPEELEYLGLRECLDGHAITLIEWPERGHGILPPADLSLTLTQHPQQGRIALLEAPSTHTMQELTVLAKQIAM
ncbi:tRNA (adenosine(37)-N6)-threonylcarbamoyltransferase complex ATPase subunit type 1 TsaE [Thiorhodospira sibirica]|uniref:tRNA (adenosine(37)-N6)-threonylcarbamoyltransferase complex ATPase subunit type 1 TsaE n=1 Tax=Thiorhodospira sibirica TaxID=154347 RepID=UPI0005924F27|nr:tRNA (adenosine(37)-N6)-threonylcarbamoyltransferase complex ATPase subunit type 1 TsaE [Thiorhodospira sibirica]